MGTDTHIDWSLEPDPDGLRKAWETLQINPSVGRASLQELAERGSVMGALYLGKAHQRGRGGPIDVREAQNWYRKAADGGSAMAFHELGLIAREAGLWEEAKTYFQLALKGGFSPAGHWLGLLYLRSNVDEAIAAFREGVRLGNVPSKILLGKTLWDRRRGFKDFAEGAWLTIIGIIQVAVVLKKHGRNSEKLE